MFKQSGDMLSRAREEARVLLGRNRLSFESSLRALRWGERLAGAEAAVPLGERQIRGLLVGYLQEANSVDLVPALSLFSVVAEIDTIGSYAGRIRDLAGRRSGRLEAGSLELPLAKLELELRNLLAETQRAYEARNSSVAREINDSLEADLLQETRELIQSLISGRASDLESSDAATLALYLRYLRRIVGSCLAILGNLVDPFPQAGRGAAVPAH